MYQKCMSHSTSNPIKSPSIFRCLKMSFHDFPCFYPGSMLPSGKHTKNYGKSPLLMGKSTISMVIFHSYVKLPEGTTGCVWMISPHTSEAADPSELSVTLRIARTSKNQHLQQKFDEERHENPGKKQGLVTVPFWEYWTSPYSSHYRPYT